MPIELGLWKMDNFYEPPRFEKIPNCFHDCYFYYYSTCSKGNKCGYRHEQDALGHETMCTKWMDGQCFDKKCKNRHMFIKKNRSRIPCFFESQPGGCNKAHCVFKHNRKDQNDDINDEKRNIHDTTSESGVEDVSVIDTSN